VWHLENRKNRSERMSKFTEKVQEINSEKKFMCLGLDTDPDSVKFPKHILDIYDGNKLSAMVHFNTAIVNATCKLVGAYKPNYTFYEAYGSRGLEALRDTILVIRAVAPKALIILDRKAADIDNSNNGTVRMLLEEMAVDAVTINPYLGGEAVRPFLDLKDLGVVVLCKTSNQGSGEFQNLKVVDESTGKIDLLYRIVARNFTNPEIWNYNGNCGLVVGATYPQELGEVRELVGDDIPILVPGVGSQGGSVEEVLRYGLGKSGKGSLLFNVSRSVIYASNGKDFALAAKREVQRLEAEIKRYFSENM
jgi:orotidine-5'-phosphate decarboxylase